MSDPVEAVARAEAAFDGYDFDNLRSDSDPLVQASLRGEHVRQGNEAPYQHEYRERARSVIAALSVKEGLMNKANETFTPLPVSIGFDALPKLPDNCPKCCSVAAADTISYGLVYPDKDSMMISAIERKFNCGSSIISGWFDAYEPPHLWANRGCPTQMNWALSNAKPD
jgi:hypothetical protein